MSAHTRWMSTIGVACFTLSIALADSSSAALVSYWPLDGDATAAVGTSGTLNGNVGMPTATTDRNGNAGDALAFLGTDQQFVSVAGGGGLAGANTGTISMWVQWNGLQDGACCGGTFGNVLSRQENGVFSNNIIGLDTNNPVSSPLTWQPFAAAAPTITGTDPVGDGVWRHIAVRFGAVDHEVFLDGQSQGTSGTTGSFNSNATTPLSIGAWSGDGAGYSTSSIDDVGILDIELTDAEILAIRNLSVESELQYNLDQAVALFDLHNAGSGTAVVGDRLWRFATGLSGGEGVVQQVGAIFELQLAGSGTGVQSIFIPEPSSFALLGLGLCGLMRRRRRRK